MAIIDKKQKRWYSKSTFDSLDKTTIPVGTEIQVAGELGQADFDSNTNTKLNAVPNKLDKPSGNPTEDSLVKVSSTGSVSWEKVSKLYLYSGMLISVDSTGSEVPYNVMFFSSLVSFSIKNFAEKYPNGAQIPCWYKSNESPQLSVGYMRSKWVDSPNGSYTSEDEFYLVLEDGSSKTISMTTSVNPSEI